MAAQLSDEGGLAVTLGSLPDTVGLGPTSEFMQGGGEDHWSLVHGAPKNPKSRPEERVTSPQAKSNEEFEFEDAPGGRETRLSEEVDEFLVENVQNTSRRKKHQEKSLRKGLRAEMCRRKLRATDAYTFLHQEFGLSEVEARKRLGITRMKEFLEELRGKGETKNMEVMSESEEDCPTSVGGESSDDESDDEVVVPMFDEQINDEDRAFMIKFRTAAGVFEEKKNKEDTGASSGSDEKSASFRSITQRDVHRVEECVYNGAQFHVFTGGKGVGVRVIEGEPTEEEIQDVATIYGACIDQEGEEKKLDERQKAAVFRTVKATLEGKGGEGVFRQLQNAGSRKDGKEIGAGVATGLLARRADLFRSMADENMDDVEFEFEMNFRRGEGIYPSATFSSSAPPRPAVHFMVPPLQGGVTAEGGAVIQGDKSDPPSKEGAQEVPPGSDGGSPLSEDSVETEEQKRVRMFTEEFEQLRKLGWCQIVKSALELQKLDPGEGATLRRALMYDDCNTGVKHVWDGLFTLAVDMRANDRCGTQFGVRKAEFLVPRVKCIGRVLCRGTCAVEYSRIEALLSGPIIPLHAAALRSLIMTINFCPEILGHRLPTVMRTLNRYARMEKDVDYRKIVDDPAAIACLLSIRAAAATNPAHPVDEDKVARGEEVLLHIVDSHENGVTVATGTVPRSVYDGDSSNVRRDFKLCALKHKMWESSAKLKEPLDAETDGVLFFFENVYGRYQHLEAIIVNDNANMRALKVPSGHAGTEKAKVNKLKSLRRCMDLPNIKLLTATREQVTIADAAGEREKGSCRSRFQQKLQSPSSILEEIFPNIRHVSTELSDEERAEWEKKRTGQKAPDNRNVKKRKPVARGATAGEMMFQNLSAMDPLSEDSVDEGEPGTMNSAAERAASGGLEFIGPLMPKWVPSMTDCCAGESLIRADEPLRMRARIAVTRKAAPVILSGMFVYFEKDETSPEPEDMMKIDPQKIYRGHFRVGHAPEWHQLHRNREIAINGKEAEELGLTKLEDEVNPRSTAARLGLKSKAVAYKREVFLTAEGFVVLEQRCVPSNYTKKAIGMEEVVAFFEKTPPWIKEYPGLVMRDVGRGQGDIDGGLREFGQIQGVDPSVEAHMRLAWEGLQQAIDDCSCEIACCSHEENDGDGALFAPARGREGRIPILETPVGEWDKHFRDLVLTMEKLRRGEKETIEKKFQVTREFITHIHRVTGCTQPAKLKEVFAASAYYAPGGLIEQACRACPRCLGVLARMKPSSKESIEVPSRGVLEADIYFQNPVVNALGRSEESLEEWAETQTLAWEALLRGETFVAAEGPLHPYRIVSNGIGQTTLRKLTVKQARSREVAEEKAKLIQDGIEEEDLIDQTISLKPTVREQVLEFLTIHKITPELIRVSDKEARGAQVASLPMVTGAELDVIPYYSPNRGTSLVGPRIFQAKVLYRDLWGLTKDLKMTPEERLTMTESKLNVAARGGLNLDGLAQTHAETMRTAAIQGVVDTGITRALLTGRLDKLNERRVYSNYTAERPPVLEGEVQRVIWRHPTGWKTGIWSGSTCGVDSVLTGTLPVVLDKRQILFEKAKSERIGFGHIELWPIGTTKTPARHATGRWKAKRYNHKIMPYDLRDARITSKMISGLIEERNREVAERANEEEWEVYPMRAEGSRAKIPQRLVAVEFRSRKVAEITIHEVGGMFIATTQEQDDPGMIGRGLRDANGRKQIYWHWLDTHDGMWKSCLWESLDDEEHGLFGTGIAEERNREVAEEVIEEDNLEEEDYGVEGVVAEALPEQWARKELFEAADSFEFKAAIGRLRDQECTPIRHLYLQDTGVGATDCGGRDLRVLAQGVAEVGATVQQSRKIYVEKRFNPPVPLWEGITRFAREIELPVKGEVAMAMDVDTGEECGLQPGNCGKPPLGEGEANDPEGGEAGRFANIGILGGGERQKRMKEGGVKRRFMNIADAPLEGIDQQELVRKTREQYYCGRKEQPSFPQFSWSCCAVGIAEPGENEGGVFLSPPEGERDYVVPSSEAVGMLIDSGCESGPHHIPAYARGIFPNAQHILHSTINRTFAEHLLRKGWPRVLYSSGGRVHVVHGFTGSIRDNDPTLVMFQYLIRDAATGSYYRSPPVVAYVMPNWGEDGNVKIALGNKDMRTLNIRYPETGHDMIIPTRTEDGSIKVKEVHVSPFSAPHSGAHPEWEEKGEDTPAVGKPRRDGVIQFNAAKIKMETGRIRPLLVPLSARRYPLGTVVSVTLAKRNGGRFRLTDGQGLPTVSVYPVGRDRVLRLFIAADGGTRYVSEEEPVYVTIVEAGNEGADMKAYIEHEEHSLSEDSVMSPSEDGVAEDEEIKAIVEELEEQYGINVNLPEMRKRDVLDEAGAEITVGVLRVALAAASTAAYLEENKKWWQGRVSSPAGSAAFTCDIAESLMKRQGGDALLADDASIIGASEDEARDVMDIALALFLDEGAGTGGVASWHGEGQPDRAVRGCTLTDYLLDLTKPPLPQRKRKELDAMEEFIQNILIERDVVMNILRDFSQEADGLLFSCTSAGRAPRSGTLLGRLYYDFGPVNVLAKEFFCPPCIPSEILGYLTNTGTRGYVSNDISKAFNRLRVDASLRQWLGVAVGSRILVPLGGPLGFKPLPAIFSQVVYPYFAERWRPEAGIGMCEELLKVIRQHRAAGGKVPNPMGVVRTSQS